MSAFVLQTLLTRIDWVTIEPWLEVAFGGVIVGSNLEGIGRNIRVEL